MLPMRPGDKVVAVVPFRDYVVIFTEMGAIIEMAFDQNKHGYVFQVIMKG